MKINTKTTSYFAAANGYDGFRSYFDRVFPSEAYDRIFVLKGGPGTGKNRLLRTLGDTFGDAGCGREDILCSSDPSSLDGLILTYGNHRVAFLDGTAPHERDAVVPGCIDELINLGGNWNTDALVRRRAEILTLNKRKKKSYEKGYDYLSLSGFIDRKTEAVYKASASYEKITDAAADLAQTLPPCEGTGGVRLVSAFCRYGRVTLNTLEAMPEKYLVCGERCARNAFMSSLLHALSRRGQGFLRCPSPMADNITEALTLPAHGIAILTEAQDSDEGMQRVELPRPEESGIRARIARLSEIRDESLLRACAAFSAASEAHFAMEDIYTAAMDFEKNDEITQNLIRRTQTILAL